MTLALFELLALLAASVIPYFVGPLRKRLYTPFPGLVAIRFSVSSEPAVQRSKVIRAALDLSVVLTIILMIMGYTFLVQALVPKGGQRVASFVPLIPGVTVPFDVLLNLMWIIAIAMVVHELFHYLACVWQGVPVRSAGVGLLFVFPIAFVEPDEDVLMKVSSLVRARIYSAGPSANAVLAVIAIILGFMLISKGIYVVKVDPNTPAWKAGIKPGDVIIEINGVRVDDLSRLRELIKSSEVLRVTVLRGGKELTLVVYRDHHKLIGIYVLPWAPKGPLSSLGPEAAIAVAQSVFWAQGVNLGLAVVNALPMIITDGGKLVMEVRRYKKLAWVADALQLVTLVMFVQALFNSVMSFTLR